MTDPKSLIIGALFVVVAVLGYMVYERQQNTVSIQLPAVKLNRP